MIFGRCLRRFPCGLAIQRHRNVWLLNLEWWSVPELLHDFANFLRQILIFCFNLAT